MGFRATPITIERQIPVSDECNLEPNECELTLDVVDKIALRLMAVTMSHNTGYSDNDQAYNAYEAADAFLKEKVKRDQFQITVDEAEEAGVDEEDCCDGVECYACNEQFPRDDVTKSMGQRYYCQCCWENLGNTWEEESDDDEELDREPIAKVEEGAVLKILGVTMFQSGDECHDLELRRAGTVYWNVEQLQTLADRINKAI